MSIDIPILERIKKLMTLADRATNTHEAALASEKMQALLQEHNLSRAEVESRVGDDSQANIQDAPREQAIHERSALFIYQRELMATIAKNNFCMHFVWRHTKPNSHGRRTQWDVEKQDYIAVTRSKAHVLIGRSENVSATILMYDYLIDAMNRLLPFQGRDKRSGAARLWLTGCAETLCERLDRQRGKAEKKQSSTAQVAGLVRLIDLYSTEDDMNNDFRFGHVPGTTTKRRLEQEAEEQENKRKTKELIASGMDAHAAWYVARGFEPTVEPNQIIQETPSKLKKQMEADKRRWNREWRTERLKDYEESRRRNHPSFLAGKEKGHDIGLGGALKGSSRKQLKD